MPAPYTLDLLHFNFEPWVFFAYLSPLKHSRNRSSNYNVGTVWYRVELRRFRIRFVAERARLQEKKQQLQNTKFYC